ncbi:MAG: hypothetical protein RJA49_1762 [Actinomycetota bacterium]|jgi:hypothetical protein
MGKHTNMRIITGVAVTAIGLFGAVAGGAAARGGGSGGGGGGTDAKAGTLVPATCTADAFGYAGYNKSGSAVTVGAGATNDGTGSTWTVTITDSLNGEVYSGSTGIVGSDWSLIQNYTAGKGQHVVSVHMESDAGAGSCDAALSFKN